MLAITTQSFPAGFHLNSAKIPTSLFGFPSVKPLGKSYKWKKAPGNLVNILCLGYKRPENKLGMHPAHFSVKTLNCLANFCER